MLLFVNVNYFSESQQTLPQQELKVLEQPVPILYSLKLLGSKFNCPEPVPHSKFTELNISDHKQAYTYARNQLLFIGVEVIFINK